MKSIVYFTVITTLICSFIIGCYILGKIGENRQVVASQLELASQIEDLGIRDNFIFLIKRNHIYYYSQIIYTGVFQFLNIMSIIYTLATLASIPTDDNKENSAKTIISLLAVIFVIINIYLKSPTRIQQFLGSWRHLTKEINNIVFVIPAKNEDEIKSGVDNALKIYYEIEDSVTIE